MSKWVVNFKGWCVVEGSDYRDAADNFFENAPYDPQDMVREIEYYVEDIEPCEDEDETNE